MHSIVLQFRPLRIERRGIKALDEIKFYLLFNKIKKLYSLFLVSVVLLGYFIVFLGERGRGDEKSAQMLNRLNCALQVVTSHSIRLHKLLIRLHKSLVCLLRGIRFML